MSRHTGHFKTNFRVIGVIEAERRALKVAKSKILLSAIAAICRKCKKWQNFDSLPRAQFLSLHFDLLHDISYPICDFKYLKKSPKNLFLKFWRLDPRRQVSAKSEMDYVKYE